MLKQGDNVQRKGHSAIYEVVSVCDDKPKPTAKLVNISGVEPQGEYAFVEALEKRPGIPIKIFSRMTTLEEYRRLAFDQGDLEGMTAFERELHALQVEYNTPVQMSAEQQAEWNVLLSRLAR